MSGESLKCPVCQARFRGSIQCSRCGADLDPLMRYAAAAYHLRESARRAIEDGAFARAAALASQAQEQCSTPQGESILRVGSLLNAIGAPPVGKPMASEGLKKPAGNKVIRFALCLALILPAILAIRMRSQL